MSEVELHELVVRMATDTAFADSVRANPAAALGGFDLTPDEVGQLTALTGDSGGSAHGLAARQSKSGLLFMGAHAPHTDAAHLAAGAPAIDHAPVIDHAPPVADAPVAPVHLEAPPAPIAPPHVDMPLAPAHADAAATPLAPPHVDAAGPVVPPALHDAGDVKLHDASLHLKTDLPGDKWHTIGVKLDDANLHLKTDLPGDKWDTIGIKLDSGPDAGGPPPTHDGGVLLNPDIKLHDAGPVDTQGPAAGDDGGTPVLHDGNLKLHDIGDVKLHTDVAPVDHSGVGAAEASGFWGSDGQLHAPGTIEHTSTGQAYYVDQHGHGHAFFPGGTDPGAAPAPSAVVDAGGNYQGVDGHVHHVGYDPSHVPDHVTVDTHMRPGDLKVGQDGWYHGSDGQLHQAGTIEHTSTGQAYYIDSHGQGHPFFPSGGQPGSEPAPGAMVNQFGQYRGIDGQLHHAGYDPTQIPDHVSVDTRSAHLADTKLGQAGAYYGNDGQLHQAGTIEHTSTGQAYYIDSHGQGHPFFPGGSQPGAEPAPGAMVNELGQYRGIDGQLHHAGYDPAHIPDHVNVDTHSAHLGDTKLGQPGHYYGNDGQLHQAGTIEHTSTGQPYYIDSHGQGHPFFPGGSQPGAQPAPGAMVNELGQYRGVDGQLHHAGYDPTQIPDHVSVDTRGAHLGDSKLGQAGVYYGTDGQLHQAGTIEHTSTGQAYYIDSRGQGHPFFPGGSQPGAEPAPGAMVNQLGQYRGVDGQLHYAGYDPAHIPDQVTVDTHLRPGDVKVGQEGWYHNSEGQLHQAGTIEHTSTGQAYFIDSRGQGHAFFPGGSEPGAEPAPGAMVNQLGQYRGVDGQLHHVGMDPTTIPATEQASEGRHGLKF